MGRIIVQLSAARLRFENDDGTSRSFPVGVGRPGSPTRTGVFPVIGKENSIRGNQAKKNIYIAMPGKICGIFGTDQAKAVGRPVTSGCLAMLNQDLDILYDLVKIGMEVEIVP